MITVGNPIYEPSCGEDIHHACAALVRLADERQLPATMRFNDIELIAQPGTDAATLVAAHLAERERLSAAYAASPEGQREAVESAARAAAWKAATAAAIIEGPFPFSVRDPERWQSVVAANLDGYGGAVIRFAARWANYMERELAAGKELADIADAMGAAADTEGISGFQGTCAERILRKVWTHGEAFAAVRA